MPDKSEHFNVMQEFCSRLYTHTHTQKHMHMWHQLTRVSYICKKQNKPVLQVYHSTSVWPDVTEVDQPANQVDFDNMQGAFEISDSIIMYVCVCVFV